MMLKQCYIVGVLPQLTCRVPVSPYHLKVVSCSLKFSECLMDVHEYIIGSISECSLLFPASTETMSGAGSAHIFFWGYFFMLQKLTCKTFYSSKWCPSIPPHCVRMLLSSMKPWRSACMLLNFMPLAALITIIETLNDKQFFERKFFDNFSLCLC